MQDSLVEAMKQWTYKGVPENPSAWLFKVAKNKALNVINREKYKRQYSSDVVHYIRSEWTAEPAMNHLFSEKEILDDQLRMMFTCCHPSISKDSQVALTLKTLCGFGIPEIAKGLPGPLFASASLFSSPAHFRNNKNDQRNKLIDAGVPKTIEHTKGRNVANTMLIYKLTIGNKVTLGKVQSLD